MRPLSRRASFSRRRMRLRSTALPCFVVTVKPARGSPPSPRSATSSRKNRPRRFSPRRTARNSARLVSRPGLGSSCRSVTGPAPGARSGAEARAAAGAAGGDDLAATLGGHACAEAMTALADELGGLIGALHLFQYRGVRPFLDLNGFRSDWTGDLQGTANRTRTCSPDVARLIGTSGGKCQSRAAVPAPGKGVTGRSRRGENAGQTRQLAVRTGVMRLQRCAGAVIC